MREALYTFISTGDKVGFYTLRVMENVGVYIDGQLRVIKKDFYIQNLSTDKQVAVEKAEQISAELELPFYGNADFDLEEIRRRSAEETKAQKEAQERAVREREEKIQQEFISAVGESVFVTGKYIGQTANEVSKIDVTYLFWLASAYEEGSRSKFQINASIAKKYIEENNIQRPGYVGEIGNEVSVSLKLKRSQWINSQFPSIMFIASTATGEEVMFFSVAKKFQALNEEDEFTIKGMVKDHRESYGGNKQTIINKPKMV